MKDEYTLILTNTRDKREADLMIETLFEKDSAPVFKPTMSTVIIFGRAKSCMIMKYAFLLRLKSLFSNNVMS